MANPDQHVVGVLSAIANVENPAVLAAFGIDQNASPKQSVKGERYWETDLVREDGRQLHIVISCIADSGNVTPEIPVERMVEEYAPESIFFVGIACGVREFKLGDVATSEVIWGYEYVKTTPKGPLDRSRARASSAHLSRDVAFFQSHSQWQAHFKKLLEKFPNPPREPVSPQLRPSVWIASGEKVMGNGELASLNKYHDKIRAGEMEGLGFGYACESQRPAIPWMVVRGISDYGDPTKDGQAVSEDTKSVSMLVPLKDEYHLAAALSAATFLHKFLQTSYTPFGGAPISQSLATGTLSDRQIIAMAGNGILISENFNVGSVKQACYELRVGDVYYEVTGEKKRREVSQFNNVLLKPHQLTVVITKETLNIPEDILGRILTKGRLFSAGILPVNTYADPGFQGKLGIVLYNATPRYLCIRIDEPVAKIEFSQLSERVENPYAGQHGYQTEIWPIPEEMVVSETDLANDTRVGSVEVEASNSYGKLFAELLSDRKRLQLVSWLALLLACISFVLFIVECFLSK